MKKTIKVADSKGYLTDKEINYIPTRFIVAMMLILLEIICVITAMVVLALYIPYFYIVIFITEIISIITIVVSSGNPDYKVAWLFFVVMLPIVGLMLFLMFHKRRLPKKAIKRINKLNDSYDYDDTNNLLELSQTDKLICSQASAICKMSNTHLYKNTHLTYYSIGEEMHKAMLEELNKAEKFIFLEYFIIEEGIFWNSILDILKEKARQGVEVKLVYDDIGCMGTLPGRYYKKLRKEYNIDTVLFSRLRGSADGEFNNRSHRKILVIDGKVGFTGGINLADEYINQNDRLGHWKDTGIKVVGNAVNELTKLFLTDFYVNKKIKSEIDLGSYYVNNEEKIYENYVVPFGDGPKPIYNYNVGKTAIINLLNQAKEYVFITTPYLVIDNELLNAIANTATRGVDVKIIVPHIPDKKFVFNMTKSNYRWLISRGVKIYEYTPGFIHSKSYIADDKVGIIGTINLDYRSLTHHFENGIWIYDFNLVSEMKEDFICTQSKSEFMNDKPQKNNLLNKFFNIIIKLFAPLL